MIYHVLLNGGLNLGTSNLERAKARAYDLLQMGYTDVKLEVQ